MNISYRPVNKVSVWSYLSVSSSAAPQEPSAANGSENSPGHTDLSLIGDPEKKTSSPSGSTSIFFDTIGEEQQNENNNNPCKILYTNANYSSKGPYVKKGHRFTDLKDSVGNESNTIIIL